MNTRNISWGVKPGGAKDCKPYHLNVPIVLKSGSHNFLEPSGPVQARSGFVLLSCVVHYHTNKCPFLDSIPNL